MSSGGGMRITNARHISLSPSHASTFEDHETPDQETGPNGNSVSLEMEMIKVSDTQAQFQAAANHYAKAMTLMKTAIGRGN
jgi:flagellar basal-body rod protein FlgB